MLTSERNSPMFGLRTLNKASAPPGSATLYGKISLHPSELSHIFRQICDHFAASIARKIHDLWTSKPMTKLSNPGSHAFSTACPAPNSGHIERCARYGELVLFTTVLQDRRRVLILGLQLEDLECICKHMRESPSVTPLTTSITHPDLGWNALARETSSEVFACSSQRLRKHERSLWIERHALKFC